jgi:3-oxoacyl-[acyl-carrier-protein] synthase-3
MRTKIIGTGSFLPPLVVSNDALAQLMDTSDEWIYSRTGIHSRHIAQEESVADMATWAGKAAVENAGIAPEQLDLIIVATVTGEQSVPGIACRVQAELGAVHAIAFDMGAACSGFLFGLSVADKFIRSGSVQHALVIGAEALSRAVNWKERNTCILFGDGAGAAVVTASEDGKGIIETCLHTDGTGADALYINDRSRTSPFCKAEEADSFVHMDGQDIFRFAVKTVPQSIKEVLQKAGRPVEEVDMFILHQANARILASVAKRLGVDLSKFPQNLETVGNTSAASIPILLDELHRQGKIQSGHRIVLAGFGGGLSWGSTFIEW